MQLLLHPLPIIRVRLAFTLFRARSHSHSLASAFLETSHALACNMINGRCPTSLPLSLSWSSHISKLVLCLLFSSNSSHHSAIVLPDVPPDHYSRLHVGPALPWIDGTFHSQSIFTSGCVRHDPADRTPPSPCTPQAPLHATIRAIEAGL